MSCKVLFVEARRGEGKAGAGVQPLSALLSRLFQRGVIAEAGPPAAPERLLEAVRRLVPDVVCIDVGGAPPDDIHHAVELLMAEAPRPVLLVVRDPRARQTAFGLLTAGALDVVQLPEVVDEGFLGRLRQQLVLLSKVTVVRHPKGRRRRVPSRVSYLRPKAPLVAIAASLGGPRALVELLSALPSDFGAPIVVCQHITPGFSDDLAVWLEAETGLRVHEAAHGQHLAKGEVFVAPAHVHMEVTSSGEVRLDDGPPVGGFKPSCDLLLKSAAAAFGAKAIGVILTGMGKDGAEGLAQIRARGGHTIAQDEPSCVVFGMPKEAILLDAAELVLPLGDIAAQLERWVR